VVIANVYAAPAYTRRSAPKWAKATVADIALSAADVRRIASACGALAYTKNNVVRLAKAIADATAPNAGGLGNRHGFLVEQRDTQRGPASVQKQKRRGSPGG
jgi:hypothetical protein